MAVNVVASSCWLEYLAGSEIGDRVSSAVEDIGNLLVPSISIYEVFKKLLRESGEEYALKVAAHMSQGLVLDLDADLSIEAARIGVERGLPLADSIIYASAARFGATLWTQDAHFKGLPGVVFFEKA